MARPRPPPQVTILNQYNNYRYNGKKYIVLSTSSWIGGKNDFLGICYLVCGCTAIGFAVQYFVLDRLYPRKVCARCVGLPWEKAR